ncbi:MAG: hypothetical protein QMD65_02510 [Patescibacteria group bacterium]|nr:hypothetical protein [Patescibacteria group bacterium]
MIVVILFVILKYTTLPWLLFSLNGVSVRFGGGAGAASLECLTGGLEYRTNAADYIVVGAVSGVSKRLEMIDPNRFGLI